MLITEAPGATRGRPAHLGRPLGQLGDAPMIFAGKLWEEPDEGLAALVISSHESWTALRTSASAPLVKVQTYQAPSLTDPNFSERMLQLIGLQVKSQLHLHQGGEHQWGDFRILSSLLVGQSLAETEDERFSVLTQRYEVLAG